MILNQILINNIVKILMIFYFDENEEFCVAYGFLKDFIMQIC